MADFSYTTVPGKLSALLIKVRQVGVPSKVTPQWLKGLGLTSSNDVSLVGVLKYIGFLDQNGSPTRIWAEFRGANPKRVLGDAVRHGYSELFSMYPDAHLRSQTDLDHFFRTKSSGGEQVIGKTISTFKALVQEADFGANESAATFPNRFAQEAPEEISGPTNGGRKPSPSVHIDIQVHISPEVTADQIDNIFSSMARHLYGAE